MNNKLDRDRKPRMRHAVPNFHINDGRFVFVSTCMHESSYLI